VEIKNRDITYCSDSGITKVKKGSAIKALQNQLLSVKKP
jgi:hypothetical protein